MHYHHLGIPTTEPRPGETWLPEFGVHVAFIVHNGAPIEFLQFTEEAGDNGARSKLSEEVSGEA